MWLSVITFPFAFSSFRWLNSKATYGSINVDPGRVPSQVEVTNLILYKYVNPSILSSSFSESIRFTMTMLICLCINLFVGASALSQRLWLSQEYHSCRETRSSRGDFQDKLRRRRSSISFYHFLQILAVLLLVGSACDSFLNFLEA
ncbi:hypothetical protein K435DRAFT_397968 [Dendrothele bispora CBS 962.96]|uniref:Uncharacterized protein n=1 Tax=Dendrothele bispora (strain CBS 962.96) TaxID=1314807 RepID=A0A4S8L8C5_DENBC|nr:hypothetical protein K435DRAFT_397968 [Dendrothele bispora CBS 962.96]